MNKYFFSIVLSVIIFSSIHPQITFQQKAFGPEGAEIYNFTSDSKGNIYCSGSKIYKSTDQGSTWNAISRDISPSCLCVTADGVIYAGSGLLYRSYDNGRNWESVISKGVFGDNIAVVKTDSKGLIYVASVFGVSCSYDNGVSFNKILDFQGRDPVYDMYIGESGEIFVCTEWGLFRSYDAGQTWNRLFGLPNTYSIKKNINGAYFMAGNGKVYRSDDNCNSWNELPPYLYDIRDLCILNGTELYMSTYASGVKRSTDEGQTWQQVNNGLRTNYITTVFTTGNGILYIGTQGGVYKSADRGDSWQKQSAGLGFISLSDFQIAPNGNYFALGYGGIYRSTDKGISWNIISNEVNNVHMISAAAEISSNGTIYISYGGLWKSTDNGDHWKKLSGPDPSIGGANDGQTGEIIVLKDGTILLAQNYGIFRSIDEGNTWARVNYDVNYPQINYFCADSAGTVYALQSDRLIYSKDNGLSWKERARFYRPTQISINSAGHLFITDDYNGTLRSTDSGLTWKQVDKAIKPDGSTDYYIHTIINDNGYVYVGNYLGVIRQSTDNGRTWTNANIELSSRINFSFRGLQALYLDNEGYLYVVTPIDGIFRSTASTTEKKVPNFFVQGELELGRQRISRNHDTTLTFFNIGSAPADVNYVLSADTLFKIRTNSFKIPAHGKFDDTLSYNLPALGSRKTIITVYPNSVMKQDTVNLSVFGYGIPRIRFEPDTLRFGKIEIGNSKKLPLKIYNIGDDTLKISKKEFSSSVFSGQNVLTTVLPGQSASDAAQFAPKTAGTVSGEMIIYSNTEAKTDILNLLATGFNAPIMMLLPEKLDMGKVQVGNTKDTTINVINYGGDTLAISKMLSRNKLFTAGQDSFFVTSGVSYKVNIRYKPERVRKDTAEVLFYNNSKTRIDSILITGEGVDTASAGKGEKIKVTQFALYQNYPNPFNPATKINYSIAAAGHVKLSIYDLLGNEVEKLIDGFNEVGNYTITFNSRSLPSGVYYYRMEAGGYIFTRKLLLLR